MKTKFSKGDRVAHSAAFLRSIGCYTGEIPQMRGTYVGTHPKLGEKFAVVRWDDEDEDKPILAVNLAKVGSAAFSAI